MCYIHAKNYNKAFHVKKSYGGAVGDMFIVTVVLQWFTSAKCCVMCTSIMSRACHAHATRSAHARFMHACIAHTHACPFMHKHKFMLLLYHGLNYMEEN